MVKSHVAEWSSSKIDQDESSDFTTCVGVLNPDPSNNGETNMKDVWYEFEFVEKINVGAREVQFIWQVLPGASTIDFNKHIRR